MIEKHYLEAHPVTSGAHHFFGYYDKFPWDGSGRYLLALEQTFLHRQPEGDEAAVLGVIDTQDNNAWCEFDKTYSWCWQQACMLQWLPSEPENHVVYNQRQDEQFVSVIRDMRDGSQRILPRPIYALSREGKWAISLNFARLHQTRPGYGYAGLPDPYQDELTPAGDGVYWMDMETGEHRLIISLEQASQIDPKDTMRGAKHWFNHAQVNTDSTRFAVLHRWQGPDEKRWHTRFLTANPDGSDPYPLADDDYFSHYDWYSPTQVVGWAHHRQKGTHYFLYTDQSDQLEIIGEDVFSVDGHCSFSPDRQWMLTDTYPDSEQMRTLILYNVQSGKRIDIGRFYAPPELQGPVRCDLHPRWSRDGKKVCFDSAHEGTRQVYVINVSDIVG